MRRTLAPTVVALGAMGALPLIATQALAEPVAFEIPAQNLAAAIVAFSNQAHIQVTLAPGLEQRKTTAVSGTMEAADALRKLLGSQLTYEFVDARNVVVRRVERTPAVPTTKARAVAEEPKTVAEESKSGALEEITVTARKREENLQQVPVSISVMTSADVEKRGITNFESAVRATPSITYQVDAVGDPKVLNLTMRGIGGASGGESSVGLYEDGFFIYRPQSAVFDLVDVERIEVLRGPQGTLYGKNTSGGAIQIISKKPTGEFGVSQTVEFGSRSEFRSMTVIDLPQWNDLSAKLTVLKSSIDGFVKNTGPSHDFGEADQRSGRMQLRWKPSAAFNADLFMERGRLVSTPTAYRQNPILDGKTIRGVVYADADRPTDHTLVPVNMGPSTSEFSGNGLTLSWDVNDLLTLKSLTGYFTIDSYADSGETVDNFGTVAAPVPSLFRNTTYVSAHQFSQELQATGNVSDYRLHYVGGLYYFSDHSSGMYSAYYPLSGYASLTPTASDSTSKAVYGQLTWEPVDHLELTAGARYTKDYRGAPQISATSSKASPALTLNYHWTPVLSTYAKVSSGYKAGGVYGVHPAPFAPETVTSYELGLKSTWLDHRLRLNLAVYENHYNDMQVTITTNPFGGTDATRIYNAARSLIRGAELDLTANPSRDLSLNLSYSYLRAAFEQINVLRGSVFDKAANPLSPYSVGGNITDLFSMTNAPTNSLDTGADYTFVHMDEGDVALHLGYRWQGAFTNNPATGPAIPGYQLNIFPSVGLFDGRVTMNRNLRNGNSLKLSAWCKNLLDKEYPIAVFGAGGSRTQVPVRNPITGVIVPAGNAGAVQGAAWAEPRAYGITLGYQF